MKVLRQIAAGALCFCSLLPTLPQASAIATRGGQSQTLEASIQQRINLAQQEMQATAVALTVDQVSSALKKQVLDAVKDILVQFSKKLLLHFNPTFDQTCQRVAHEAASLGPPPEPYPEDYDPQSSTFTQLQETVFAKDTCETSSSVGFKPRGTVSRSFLEARGFWDNVRNAVGGFSVLAGPLLARLKKSISETMHKVLMKQVGPQLEREMSTALNQACDRAILQVEEEEGYTDHQGYQHDQAYPEQADYAVQEDYAGPQG